MGAVPKRKISKGRKNRRRAQDFLKPPAMSICAKCKEITQPHVRCTNCGFYGQLDRAKVAKSKAKSKKAAPKSKSSK